MWMVTLVTGWAASAAWIAVVVKRTREQELCWFDSCHAARVQSSCADIS
jgi:hypothetical protein